MMNWNEVLVILGKVLSWHMFGRTDENHEEPPVRIASLPAEI
jgi:hypothetical protein